MLPKVTRSYIVGTSIVVGVCSDTWQVVVHCDGVEAFSVVFGDRLLDFVAFLHPEISIFKYITAFKFINWLFQQKLDICRHSTISTPHSFFY